MLLLLQCSESWCFRHGPPNPVLVLNKFLVSAHVYMHAFCVCACMYILMCVFMYICVYICVRARVYVCVCVSVGQRSNMGAILQIPFIFYLETGSLTGLGPQRTSCLSQSWNYKYKHCACLFLWVWGSTLGSLMLTTQHFTI